MVKILNIEFAPLFVPLERRLQTLAAALWFAVIVFGIPIGYCFTFLVLLFGYTWMRLLMLGYVVFCYWDRGTCRIGGRTFGRRWLRDTAWFRYFANYFPVKLVKTTEIEPSKNYLLCSFPHGLLATGAATAFSTNALDCCKLFPGLDFRLVTLDQHFQAPFFREFAYTTGAVSADAASLEYLLTTKPDRDKGPTEAPVEGRAIVLITGGAAEAFRCIPGTYSILLNRRKGFVKVAMRCGASIVPVFSFGENDLYNQVSNPPGSRLRKAQEFLKQYIGIAPVIPIGRGFFQYSYGFLPNRRPVTVVVGAPIDLPQNANPSQEDVDKYHKIFTEQLIELFETHKSKYLKDHKNISLVLE